MVTKRRSKVPIHKKSWKTLNPKQKLLRERSLDVLAESRKTSKSLSKISKDYGISPRTVIYNTNGFKKINRRWISKKFDKISRVMKINENGKEVSIEINDSRKASLIGRYLNDVKQLLKSGNVNQLAKYRTKRIKDVNGRFHSFDTEPDKIIEINQRIEEPEFYEVYST